MGANPHDHLVQLYRGVEEVAAAVAPFLAAADVAIVVARAERVAALTEGVDPDGLIVIDARTALDGVLVDGRPDPDAFERTVGSVVREAATRGRVRAYGEMVDMLWRAGDVTEAIAIEGMWTDLQRRVAFDLYCAYEADPVVRVDGGPDVVRAVHTHAVTVRRFDHSLEAPRAARHFVASAVDTPEAADIALVVAELATNAVVHAASPFTVELAESDTSLRITVTDGALRVPMPRRAADDHSDGRGMQIIAALAGRWGVDPTPNGKRVWAEVDRIS